MDPPYTFQRSPQVWPNVFMPAFPDTFAANYRHFSSFLRQAEEVMEVSEAGELQRKLVDFQRKWKTQASVPAGSGHEDPWG